MPDLVRVGVSSLKIEGRLKGPEYVAATTRLYRKAIDAATGQGEGPTEEERRAALQTFTRGSGPGFFPGVDHQRLVEGRACDHRGLEVGTLSAIGSFRGRPCVSVRLTEELSRGDGILVEGGLASAGEIGGRVWGLNVAGRDVERAPKGSEAQVWLGPDVKLGTPRTPRTPSERRIFRTSDPQGNRKVLVDVAAEKRKTRLDLRVAGRIGEPFVLEGRTAAGAFARVTGDAAIEEARSAPLDEAALRDKLGKLGDSPFELGALEVALPAGTIVAVSSLNRARRALVEALAASAARHHATTDVTYTDLLVAAAPPADRRPPPGLFVLCRSLEQANAALGAGAAGVYLDFLELTGTGEALRSLRGRGAFVGVAPPRIRKPGEEKIDRFLASLEPDAILVRGLGALRELPRDGSGPLAIGDFSLNVTNRLTAAEMLGRGLAAFTPSFDLDAAQLVELMAASSAGPAFGPWAEIVIHHPMALFHMEHCVIAALLSAIARAWIIPSRQTWAAATPSSTRAPRARCSSCRSSPKPASRASASSWCARPRPTSRAS